jgi:DNA (cytosine-5)-methyltransferase 1
MRRFPIPLYDDRIIRDDEIIVDLFAGGGGASTGMEAALGRPIDLAINHDPVALAAHKDNHPWTTHLEANLWEVRPSEATGGKPVGLLWASPDCRHHSVAKGGAPRSESVRSLPNVVVRWVKAVRPRMLALENVIELQSWGPLDQKGKRIKARAGETFRRWKRAIERLGYVVEHRILDASLYGARTRRRRFFLIARCDGVPIVWPDPTHGEGRLPLHTAAECIDWNLPVPSIFERKKPLAEKTLWRIAQGIRRFVLESDKPFIVKVNHGKREARVEPLDEPLSTVTATQRGHAVVVPHLTKFQQNSVGQDTREPLDTVMAGAQRFGVVAPTLIQTGQGERKGQRARVPGLQKPLGTIVACGQRHALVGAYLSKYFGDPLRKDGKGGVVLGSELEKPIGAVTTRDHHAFSAVFLAKYRGTSDSHPGCADINKPMPTISAGGQKGGIHVAEVRAFLTAYYSTGTTHGQKVDDPLRTIRTKHCLGIVTVSGTDYQIVDIGLRMLQPHELLRAQFGKYAEHYDLSAATTVADKVRLIGNSVCPELAEAVIAANLKREVQRAA